MRPPGVGPCLNHYRHRHRHRLRPTSRSRPRLQPNHRTVELRRGESCDIRAVCCGASSEVNFSPPVGTNNVCSSIVLEKEGVSRVGGGAFQPGDESLGKRRAGGGGGSSLCL